MQQAIAIDQAVTVATGGIDRAPSRIRVIREIAAHVETELREVAEGWDRLPEDERGELAQALAQVAPGVLNLLCPIYGRFGAA